MSILTLPIASAPCPTRCYTPAMSDEQQQQGEPEDLAARVEAMAFQQKVGQMMERVMADEIARLQAAGLSIDDSIAAREIMIAARESLREGLRQIVHQTLLRDDAGPEHGDTD